MTVLEIVERQAKAWRKDSIIEDGDVITCKRVCSVVVKDLNTEDGNVINCFDAKAEYEKYEFFVRLKKPSKINIGLIHRSLEIHFSDGKPYSYLVDVRYDNRCLSCVIAPDGVFY